MGSMTLADILEAARDEGRSKGILIGEARGWSEACASIRSRLIAGGMSPQEADKYVNPSLDGD